ncbi:MAG: extracellular solute-binding protein [Phycisphaerae bacterium]|nr:extracellular solute-binding protein [Phycisphaerae bacterium]
MTLEKNRKIARRWTAAALSALTGMLLACNASPPESVVVYTSIDQPFAERILADFTQRTGIRVDAVFDSEAGKTTGLVRRLIHEAAAPRCAVWWSSEVFGTIELARAGVLSPYESPAAADIPREWKDPQQRWTGVAARLRVIAYDPKRVVASDLPESWLDAAPIAALTAKQLPLAIANPQFGTTRGHIAALWAFGGEETARKLVQVLREQRTIIADGNSHAIRLVEQGGAAWCWTDTDDYVAARSRGAALELFVPTIRAGGPPMAIPCSVALVRGAPNEANAKKLIDFLVSAAAEEALAKSDSANIPVRAALRERLSSPFKVAPQPLDWDRISDAILPAMKFAREELLR